MIKFIKNNFSLKSAKDLLLKLLFFDLCFVIIHIATCYIYYIGMIENFGDYNYLVLTQDESWAEVFQYLKYVGVIVLTCIIIFKTKNYAYISWLFLFLFFLLDDSLSMHETMGEIFVDKFGLKPMFGLRDVDFGELFFMGIAGTVIMLSFVIAYFKGGVEFKKRTMDIFIFIVLMVFFGIGFDMLHEILGENLKVGFVIGLIEDGGEMIVMSLIVWYVFYLVYSNVKEQRYLFEYFTKLKL